MDIIAKLPPELKDIVWLYVRLEDKVWVSKYYYEKYHNTLIMNKIPDFNKYIISLIIKKENYIFELIYNDMRFSWKFANTILYGNRTFLTYAAFLKFKANEYNNRYLFELINSKRVKKNKKKSA
jgi:hypothetical protein